MQRFGKTLNLTSYAKLNLYLKVLGKHSDNYHSIFTLFERISLSDQIRLRLLPQREIRIVLSGRALPSGPSNMAYQAASLIKREFGIREGVEINIKKHIPISAGLGGGSSNAAVVLAGLNQLWKLNLRVKQLVNLARQIGSDIPFFLHNSPFAYGTCRGDEIKVLKLPVELWHIIVKPPIKVLSSIIYKRWDQAHKKRMGSSPTPIMSRRKSGKLVWELANNQSIIKILKPALLKKDFSKLNELLFNSLEEITTAMHPVISKIRMTLSDLGLEAISMSGSGPAVFGLISSRKEAYAIVRQLKAKWGNWDVLVAKTV